MGWQFQLEDDLLAELGKRISQFRKNAGMSQQDLADRVGVSRVNISEIERGANTTVSTLLRILKVFNRLDALEEVLRVPTISPKQLFEQENKKRGK
ncbi:MAG: helix-turn-helix domain-containing protein [Flavobacteriales bacterium]|nr:helix-turn-helix domain-containing protein [Flavobacteriales bacterium]